MRFWLHVSFCIIALGALVGCSNYRLGTATAPTFSALYVEPVTSQTLLPQSRAIISTQVREAFAKDGRIRIVNSPEAADAILHVKLRDYRRDIASVQENDTGLARKFTLSLEVACTLQRKNSDMLFTDRILQVQRDAFTDGGQLQSEYQTVPLLAEALAKKIVHAVLDVW